MDAVAAVRSAGDDAADENDFIVPLLHGDREVTESRQVLLELSKLLVVGGKQRARAALCSPVQVLNYRPGN